MTLQNNKAWIPLIVLGLLIIGCTAGHEHFTSEEPAGFWYGLFHGFIVVISFVISLFSDTVQVYELNNNGTWYDFGFVLGVVCMGGGSAKAHSDKKHHKPTDAEWDDIARKVELKVLSKLKEFADEPTSDEGDTKESTGEAKPFDKDKEWEEIGKKVEKKIKRKLKKWAEED